MMSLRIVLPIDIETNETNFQGFFLLGDDEINPGKRTKKTKSWRLATNQKIHSTDSAPSCLIVTEVRLVTGVQGSRVGRKRAEKEERQHQPAKIQ